MSRSGEIFGRETELVRLQRFVDAIPSGPHVLVIHGEAGVGKTTLWREGIRLANERSYQVLSCRPAEYEVQLPYASFGDLLESVGTQMFGVLPSPQQRALEVVLLRADTEGGPVDQRTISVAALGLLVSLARPEPLIVAIDDAQWLDLPTARVLQFAARRLESEPIGILLSARVVGTSEVPLDLDRALSEERRQYLPVTPLEEEALECILSSKLGTTFLPRTLRQLHRAAGGNPFFALEIGRALLRRGMTLRPLETFPIPETLRALLAERLLTLSSGAREVALMVSALSRPTLPLVQTAVSAFGASSKSLDEVIKAGIIEIGPQELRFTHPLFASAIYSESTSEHRQRMHARLAELVMEPEEKARHLSLAAEGPDPRVARALDRAARAAWVRGAPDAAAALSERAIMLTAPTRKEDIRRRSLEAASYHFTVGDLSKARTLLEKLIPKVPPGAERARVLQRLAEVIAQADGFPAAQPLLEQGLIESAKDPSIQVDIEIYLSFVHLVSGKPQLSSFHAKTALHLAEGLSNHALLLESLAWVVFFEFLLGNGLRMDLLDRAFALEERTEYVSASARPGIIHGRDTIALALKWADQFDHARLRLRARLHQMEDLGDESYLPYLLYHLSELECWAGNWELATHYADRGCRAARYTGQDALLPANLYSKALVETHLGRVESAREAAEQGRALCERTGNVAVMMLIVGTLGFLELSLGNPEEAHRHLGQLAQQLAAIGATREPGRYRFAANEVEALIALGDLKGAGIFLDEFEEQAKRLQRTWGLATAARCRGLLLSAQGDHGSALITLKKALEEHERLPQPFELARTLLALGMVRRRAKQKRASRESLDRALELFGALGARLWIEKAKAELGRIGGRAAAPNDLTPTESRIAELVAQGSTNKEVARELFISVKTVEASLTRVYRKLGAASRRELARQVMEGPARGLQERARKGKTPHSES